MDDLPPLCVKTISEHLVLLHRNHDFNDFNAILRNAKCAARLAMVGNTTFTQIAFDFYNGAVDPGCMDEANTICKQDALEREAATMILNATATAAAATTTTTTLSDLKAACVAAALPISGTKAKLIERLERARSAATTRLDCSNHLTNMPRCPVRRRVVALVLAVRSSKNNKHKNIAAATALKDPFKIPRAHLDAMECELARNPHYRSAAPMRLYNLVDIAWASLQINGPGAVPMKCVDEAAKQEIAAKATAKANKLAATCAKRRACLIREMQLHACPIDDAYIDKVVSTSKVLTDYMNGSQSHKMSDGAVLEALNMAIYITQRSRDLEQALNAAGCELRRDSKLCNAYIYHDDGSIAEIVNIMSEMQFYFAHTDYKQILDDLYRQTRRNWHGRDSYSSQSERAKDKALATYIRKMPCPLTYEIIQGNENIPESLKQKIIKMQKIRHVSL